MKKQQIFLQLLLNILTTVIFLMSIFISQLSAQNITGNQTGTWTLSNSPYVVQGDIIVPGGQILTIEPGVVVKFAGFYRITVKGTLIAKGTPNDQIIFTSDKDFEFGDIDSTDPGKLSPHIDDWNVIEFFDDFGQQQSEITHCIIRYSAGILQCRNASPYIKNIFIVDCKNNQVSINGGIKSITQGRENDIPVSKSSVSKAKTSTSEQSSALDNLLKGEEFTFGEIKVTTASKKAEKILDAPGIITVITEQEINSFGAINLLDILQRVPGMQPLSSHLLVQNVIALRGDLLTHTDNHILILLNGRPMREGVQGGQDFSIFTAFPIMTIERIEIIRGPGSVLYGSNAFAGVINIITKKTSNDSEFNASICSGSYGGVDGNITGGLSKGDLNVVLGAKFFQEKGWEYHATTVHPSPAVPDVTDFMNMGEKNIGINTVLNYKNFCVIAYYANNNYDMMGVLPHWSQKGDMVSNRFFLDLGYKHLFSKKWELNTNLTHNYYKLTITSGGLENPHLANDILGECYVNGEITENLNLLVGGLFDNRRRPEAQKKSSVPGTYSQVHFSMYSQLDYKLHSKIKLITGIQLNKPDEGDIDIVPRLGTIFNFSKTIGLKVLYGQAFRSPWPVEQLIDYVPVLVGNPKLNPEKIATFDAQVLYNIEKAQFSLTYFRSHYYDLITRIQYPDTTLPRSTQTFTNKGEMDVDGVELEGKVNLAPELYLIGSYVYQDNKNDMTLVPHSIAKLGLSYQNNTGISIGLFNTFFGKPKKNNGRVENPVAKAVNLLSANISYKVQSGLPLVLSLYVQNALDQKYYFPEFSKGWVNTLPLEGGRAFYGRITIEF